MPAGKPLVELRGVTKDYRGLRPLRIEHLTVEQSQSVALLGFDQVMAEVLVDLVMGTTMPDAGHVTIRGLPTTAIPDGETWLKMLDDFGLLSQRAVLVDRFTAEQNLAMPFSLDIEDMPATLRAQARLLADELGLSAADLTQPVGQLPEAARVRIRLGRALALNPRLVLAEHPSATLSADDAPSFAADFSRIIEKRQAAALVLTADQTFASAVADRVLTLQPATGALIASSGWRRWFS